MAQKQKEQKVRKRISCEKCNYSFGYHRIKKKEWVCRSCGHVQKMEAK